MTNANGEVLLVRKARTSAFMQPGGKPMVSETPSDALVRELAEELAITIRPADLDYLGEAEADAANEPGERVSAAVFQLEYDGEIEAQAEIAEARWVDPVTPGEMDLAPLTREFILPWKTA